MGVLVLMVSFFVLLFVGVPIAYSLCLSALFYMIGFTDIPLIIVGQQMLKGVDSFTLMAIPFFVIAGGLMESGGISKRIVNFAKTIVGFLPGGLAVVTVVASMIFAAMTGAGAATTAAVGGIMIPSMEENGYDGGYASAVQAVGGIFGPLIPPSILMVLYGVASGESVGDMLMAGLLPGLFLGIIVIAVVIYQCIKKGYKGVGKFSLKNAVKAFYDAIWAIFAPIIILGGIYSGLFTPTEASAICCLYCLIVGLFVYKELKVETLGKIVFKAVKTAAGIMLIVSATQAFGWVITRAGIPQFVAECVTAVISSPAVFMLAVCLILLVAGCFIDAVPALLIFAPILIPTAKEYGISLIHFGVVMVVVLCIGLVTPPVGLNLFVASSVGGQPIHKIIPHLPVLIGAISVGALIIVFVPAIATFLPSLL
ncbi:MAG: TRAP transporter large permease [Lachnospiraceae bacterium]|nr:TRAP transporter large permease [Lachnospiraceae bacterium]